MTSAGEDTEISSEAIVEFFGWLENTRQLFNPIKALKYFDTLMSCEEEHVHEGYNCIPKNIILGEE